MSGALDQRDIQERLSELAIANAVPGAVLGIAAGDSTVLVAYGVTNVETEVPVTTDTLFQLGSMTKVWTATALMRLMDEGALDLDRPIIEYLPELKLSDPDVTAQVTTRQLLNHTSGIDGDFFADTGRGDDCLADYVEALSGLPQNHPIGATWSYCNSGYVIAGRLIERLTNRVWDAAMRDMLFTPLALTGTVTLPEDALLYRAAVGHVHEGEEPPRRAPVWMLPRALGPAGLITARAADVLAFARMHVADGVIVGGPRVLSAAAAQAMRAEEVRLPDPYTLGDSWGLGWFRLDWDGEPVVGHDGNTIGQAAYLRLLPQRGLAVTLLTNGGRSHTLYESLVREVIRELAGVEMTRPLAPPQPPVTADISAHVGVYERASVRIEVWSAESGPRMRITNLTELEGLPDKPEELDLVPVDADLYLVRAARGDSWEPVTFYRLDDGTPYLHYGVRATPKVA